MVPTPLINIPTEIRDAATFRVFGLTVASEFPLPELPLAWGPASVHIRYGKTPEELENALLRQKYCQAGPDQMLLNVPNVGRFHVRNGTCITIEPVVVADKINIRLFLLGTAFGALMMQRGILPVHGSSIVLDGCGIIFTGASGVGKSSLLAAFRQQGASFLSDDVAAAPCVRIDVASPWGVLCESGASWEPGPSRPREVTGKEPVGRLEGHLPRARREPAGSLTVREQSNGDNLFP